MPEKKDKKKGKPAAPWQTFASAGLGAAVAEMLTLPVDISKVRLQTQKPLPDGTLLYRNLVQSMWTIQSREGIASLWKGAVPSLARQISYTGLSFVMYAPIRDKIIGQKIGDGPGEIRKVDVDKSKLVLSGGLAGGLSIICVNPTDVVKTKMQHATGKTNMMSLARDVVRTNGVRGLWLGVQPNVARCFIGNACEIGCYDIAKTELLAQQVYPLDDGYKVHLGAASAAGMVSAVCSTPVDVVKTRLMNQAGNVETGETVYKGVLDCFIRMPREEGLRSLYKGFGPLAVRKIVWTVAHFLVYERVLKLVTGSYMA